MRRRHVSDSGFVKNLLEKVASVGNPRMNAYRTARMLHERFMVEHEISVEMIAPEQRLAARTSPELQEARRLYDQVRAEEADAAHDSGSSWAVATLDEQIGQLEFLRGNTDESEGAFRGALGQVEKRISIERSDLESISTCHFFLALISLEFGRTADARTHLRRATEADEKLRDPYRLAADRRVLARFS